MAKPKPPTQLLAKAPYAERLRRVVTGGDEVHPRLPCLRHHALCRLTREESLSAGGDRVIQVVGPGTRDDSDAMYSLGARVEYQRLAAGQLVSSREQLACGETVAGQRCDETDRPTTVERERHKGLGAERTAKQRVVAQLRVGVKWQVVGGEPHVCVEQNREATPERQVDRARLGVPEDPMVHEHQVRALGGGELEELGMRAHAARQSVHRVASRHLQTVGAVVVEEAGLEHAVELGNDLSELGGHCGAADNSGVAGRIGGSGRM
jgi:hypothetical protein